MMDLDLSAEKIIGLSYDEKIKIVEQIGLEMLQKREEFATISARYAELRAHLTWLKEARSAIQSALRAERSQ